MSIYAVLRAFPSVRNSYVKTLCACNNLRKYSAKQPAKELVTGIDPLTGEVTRRKANVIPKITLLSEGDKITVTTLKEAESLSKRRNLKLVKIVDIETKTKRPLYKLMTGAEFHAEDLKQREQRKKDKENAYIKGEKVLILKSRITEHDLQVQLKKTLKWTEKNYEVRVVINGNPEKTDLTEKIYTAFEEYFKPTEAKVVQKRSKDGDIKFQVLPPVRKSSESNVGDDSGGKPQVDKKTL